MKFLEDPYQTLGVGFALSVGLIAVYLGMAGVGAGDTDWFGLIVRWIHFLAGITWIGLLYFFNLINAGFLKSLDGPTKNIVIPKLMPAALNWFRHGATVTVLAGVVLYGYLYSKGGDGGHCVRDRRPAGNYHDGKCSWSHLAEPKEGHCGGGCRCTGHSCSAGDGSVGENGLDCLTYQLFAVHSHVVLYGSGEPLQVSRHARSVTGGWAFERMANPLFLALIIAGPARCGGEPLD